MIGSQQKKNINMDTKMQQKKRKKNIDREMSEFSFIDEIMNG